MPVEVDRLTGETRRAHLFVAVMGGSSLSFACATWSEQFADWAEAHNCRWRCNLPHKWRLNIPHFFELRSVWG